MTLDQLEQMLLNGRAKKDIQGELSDAEYNRMLYLILDKHKSRIRTDMDRITYISKVESLFFEVNNILMDFKCEFEERMFLKNQLNELGNILCTFQTLTPFYSQDMSRWKEISNTENQVVIYQSDKNILNN